MPIPLRKPDKVMHLERLGSFHQSRLSFMRSLIRKLKNEQWEISQSAWQINEDGEGYAIYTAKGLEDTYSLVAFAHNIDDDKRIDRLIAEVWDNTFCLFDGIPTKKDIKRLYQNVPKQEAGRISPTELSLSRANRSGRVWDYVVDALAKGKQPDLEKILETGYLMRTTAVYGSGKFGALDRDYLLHRSFARNPFALEMLSVYLIRCFVLDLVDFFAKAKGGVKAVKLQKKTKRALGIGNSTGLGMSHFLINHPILLHQWIITREKALALIRNLNFIENERFEIFNQMLNRAIQSTQFWHTEHPVQKKRIEVLIKDLFRIQVFLKDFNINTTKPWNQIFEFTEQNLSLEAQEQLVSILFEPYPELIDSLSDEMFIDETRDFVIDATMSLKTLKVILNQHYQWIWQFDFSSEDEQSKFWYISQDKLEPRVGSRERLIGDKFELPFNIVKLAQELYKIISHLPQDLILAEFLRENDKYRHIVRRIQQTAKYPYSEIQDNLISKDLLPINLLRCKLSFFGATHFDPKSDRWIRICMYQHAPLPDELESALDSWAYPEAI